MAYHGYLTSLKQYLSKFQGNRAPSVLEVGIDRGVTLLPLVVNMATVHPEFLYVGVDVNVQEALKLTVQYLEEPIPQSTFLIQGNSLNVLPEIISQGMKFDLILIDGDHNYHTVSQEMQYVPDLIKDESSIVLIDDYLGKWSTRDLFYSTREGYENVSDVTKPVETEKHGVKPAVDEWLEKNPNWSKSQPLNGEPVLLMQKG